MEVTKLREIIELMLDKWSLDGEDFAHNEVKVLDEQDYVKFTDDIIKAWNTRHAGDVPGESYIEQEAIRLNIEFTHGKISTYTALLKMAKWMKQQINQQ